MQVGDWILYLLYISSGLTQCEYCKRRFNDAAYFKHVVQCKEKQTDAKMQPTEEQKEAKERFMRRMKVWYLYGLFSNGLLLYLTYFSNEN